LLRSSKAGTGWLVQSVRQGIPPRSKTHREQGWLQEWAKTGAAARCRRGSARTRLRNGRARGPHPNAASRATTPRADLVAARAQPTRRADLVVSAKAIGRTNPNRPADQPPRERTHRARPAAEVDPPQRADPPHRGDPTHPTDQVPAAQAGRPDSTQRTGLMVQAILSAGLAARAQATGRANPGRRAEPTGQAARHPRCRSPAPLRSRPPTSRWSGSCRHRRARHHCRCCAASPRAGDPARAPLARQHHKSRQSTGERSLPPTVCLFRPGCRDGRRALPSGRSPPLRDLHPRPVVPPAGPVPGRCRRASRSGSPGSGETALSGRSRC
jgi:hypothetical protein